MGGLLKRAPVENMTMLRDVTGYLMPGTLTLVVGMCMHFPDFYSSILSPQNPFLVLVPLRNILYPELWKKVTHTREHLNSYCSC